MTVYFIWSPTGHVKIGFTGEADPKSRLLDLQTASPLPLTVLAFVEGTTSDERDLHHYFESDRGAGEWFRVSPRLVGLIDHVREFRTLDGWRMADTDPARFSDFIRTFGEPLPLMEMHDHLGTEGAHWRLRAAVGAAEYRSAADAPLTWPDVMAIWHDRVHGLEAQYVDRVKLSAAHPRSRSRLVFRSTPCFLHSSSFDFAFRRAPKPGADTAFAGIGL